MNLYRSFGNLMETWVTEDDPCQDSPWLGNKSKDSSTPSSCMETNLRSESVDSGVETASCDTVLSMPGSVSTDHTELDLFMPQRGLSPASTSQSPVLSSPAPSSASSLSPQFCPIREEEGSPSLRLKEEASLQRTDSVHLREKPKTLTVEEVLNRRPRSALLPKRHTSDLGVGQRTETLGWRANSSLPIRQKSDLCRRPVSADHDKERSEGLAVGDSRELSPGLNYLEQVCQMLEGIAREQMHNRGMHPGLEALWEDQDAQIPDSRQTNPAEEDKFPSCPVPDSTKGSMSKPRQWKYGHFRQRSASDTALSTIHLRKLNTHDKGQLMSTTDLLERVEDEEEKQDSTKTEKNKTHKSWRLKFGSFGKGEWTVFDTKGQQTQSSEKTSARRRLSKLFRRRRKTLPM